MCLLQTKITKKHLFQLITAMLDTRNLSIDLINLAASPQTHAHSWEEIFSYFLLRKRWHGVIFLSHVNEDSSRTLLRPNGIATDDLSQLQRTGYYGNFQRFFLLVRTFRHVKIQVKLWINAYGLEASRRSVIMKIESHKVSKNHVNLLRCRNQRMHVLANVYSSAWSFLWKVQE